jgi:hypothetical protein
MDGEAGGGGSKAINPPVSRPILTSMTLCIVSLSANTQKTSLIQVLRYAFSLACTVHILFSFAEGGFYEMSWLVKSIIHSLIFYMIIQNKEHIQYIRLLYFIYRGRGHSEEVCICSVIVVNDKI